MLTKEGEKMYKSLSRNKKPSSPLPSILPKNIPLSELQVEFYRTEITDLLENSKRVIIDCDKILSLCESQDEYLRNDARIAKVLHCRLVDKYTRLLNYQSALKND